ncbi:MAG: alpha/beta hydrolase [Actinomycetia bacterium]|nr:alpha/beta hydrolase [Actinomycetes bacterium]
MFGVRTVEGGGGVRLLVTEGGNPGGPPIIFLHGFSQTALAWLAQFEDPRLAPYHLLAPDLRGHGASDKPRDAYGDGRLWADDVAAVLGLAGGRPAVLVGWSYGGLVIADYLRHRGPAAVRGVVLVGAVLDIGTPDSLDLLHPDFRALTRGFFAVDAETSVGALAALARLMFAAPPDAATFYRLLGAAVSAPPHVRRALFVRTQDNDDVWRALRRPVLIVHGEADRVVVPAAADRHAARLAAVTVRRYPGVGHAPFLEAADRFNRDLAGWIESLP